MRGFQLQFYKWVENGGDEELVTCHVFNLTSAAWRKQDELVRKGDDVGSGEWRREGGGRSNPSLGITDSKPAQAKYVTCLIVSYRRKAFT